MAVTDAEPILMHLVARTLGSQIETRLGMRDPLTIIRVCLRTLGSLLQRARLLGPVALALCVAGPVHPQDALRAWGWTAIDTRATALAVAKLATGWVTTLYLRSDGQIFVSGGGPMADAPPLPPGMSYVDVDTYREINQCAVRSDGQIILWDRLGGLYNTAPVLPPGVGYMSASIGAGVGSVGPTVLALRSDGVVVGWGDNAYGQATIPTIAPGVAVVKFATGAGANSFLLLSDGSLNAWGRDPSITSVPTPPAGTTYVDFWLGWSQVYALRSDDVTVAWGSNVYGQCNVVPNAPGTRYTDITAGEAHTSALRSDGILICWGDNSLGQGNHPQIPAGMTCVQVEAGQTHTMALLSDGSVLSWGTRGNLEQPPPRLSQGERWTSLAMSGDHVLGLTSTGWVHAWGANAYYGACNVPNLPAGRWYIKIAVGANHSLALRSDGELVAFGANYSGQANVPALPSGITYVDCATGRDHSVALRSDGNVVAVGDNSYGACNIPALPNNVHYVAADGERKKTMLLRSDGTIVTVGNTTHGESFVPALPSAVEYVAIACGEFHNIALRSDGLVEHWGAPNSDDFPPLPSGVVYVEIDAGSRHSLARRSDGRVVVESQTNFLHHEDFVPQLGPGESFVEIDCMFDESSARLGPTSTYVVFANGCTGTPPATRLIPRDTPRIGETMSVRLFDLPQNAAFVVFSWSRVGPISLASFGMPGCFQNVSIDAAVFLSGTNGQAGYELPIPNWPGLVGLHFFNQAIVLDAAANPLGAVVSDAAEGVIGHW